MSFFELAIVHFRRGIGLGALLFFLFGGVAYAQPPNFTQPFDPTTSKIEVDPWQKWGIYRSSDVIRVSTSDGSPIRVFNLQGTTVYQGAPGALPSLPVDHYFVECPGDRTQFCVLPDDYQGASFLGCDAENPTDSASSQRLAQIQPTWARVLTKGQWPVVEPLPGIWNWTALDNTVAANQGRKIIVTAFIRPDWLTNNDDFLPQFLRYVTAMAERYDGKIYAIQIWNEPWVETVTANGMAWGDIGNPVTGNMEVDLPVWGQTLATLISASKQAIRSVSSSIKIVGPDWQSLDYANLTEDFMGMIGDETLDALTFHQNTYFPTVCLYSGPDGTNELANLIQPFTDAAPWMMTEFHPLGASALGLPQSFADPGIPLTGIDWKRGLSRLVQSVVTWTADGAQAVIPHVMAQPAPNLSDNYEVYGWEWGSGFGARGPHPKTSAFLMTGYWLNNATFVDARTPGQKIFLYGWSRPDSSSLVFAWAAEGQTVSYQANPSFMATDIFGRPNQSNSLTETPSLFFSSTLSPSALIGNILAGLPQNYSVSPVWRPVDNQSVRAGQNLQFTLSAFDPNRAPVTYTATSLPEGASLDSHTGIFSWTPTSTQVGSYNITFTATDDQGKSALMSTTVNVVEGLLDGLTDYWKFDEGVGTITADATGQASGRFDNYTASSFPTWRMGKSGYALSFDGTGGFVSLPSSALKFTNNFSIATWLYPQAASGEGAFISVRCSYQQSGFRLFIVNNNLVVQGQTTNGWKGTAFGAGSILSSNWYHIAVVYDKSTVKAYINGLYQGSADWGGDLVMNETGASQIGTQGGYYFIGLIDDMMLFNRTLDSQEVLELYQTVDGVPDVMPVVTPIAAKKVRAGQPLAFRVDASDPQGAGLSYSAAPLPAGAIFNSANGAFLWTPSTNQVGVFNVNFNASNGKTAASQSANITVSKPNSPPILKAIKPKRARAGRRFRIALKAKDGDKDALVYSISPMPAGATFDPKLRRFSWTPTSDQVGQYNLTAIVTDGYDSDTKPVVITVY
jgi:hypothetical protein